MTSSVKFFLVTIIFLQSWSINGDDVPKTCLDIKLLNPNVNKNGHFVIYGKNKEAFTVYCDFNSEPPFVWTLIESFSRDIGSYRSTVPGHEHFQPPFRYNYPYSQCRPDQWKAFRLSQPYMASIWNARTTNYWRATCNFDLLAKEVKFVFNHTDYMRVQKCRLNMMTYYSGRPCIWMDYLNIRGHTCRKCYVPMWFGPKSHPSVVLSLTQNYCGSVKFPGYAGSPNEYNFGTYNGYNRDFSCTTYPDSTTNWWFGDMYIPTNRFTNIKP